MLKARLPGRGRVTVCRRLGSRHVRSIFPLLGLPQAGSCAGEELLTYPSQRPASLKTQSGP